MNPDDLISPPEQPISEVDLRAIAQASKPVVSSFSDPHPHLDMISSDEMTAMTKAILTGKPIIPSSPYAAKVLTQLRKDIEKMLRAGVGVEIPGDPPA